MICWVFPVHFKTLTPIIGGVKNECVQVSDERDSEELRKVCVKVACSCLPNVVVSLPTLLWFGWRQ